MILQETARSGHSVLRFDNRLLASSIDPVREAQSWAKKVAAGVRKGDVCVIGAGCGYHIDELQKLLPKTRIVVIEASSEVAEWVLSKFTHFKKENFLVGSDPSADLEAWCDTLFGVSQAFLHGATTQIHTEWSHRMHRFVVARDRNSFLTQVRARPELLAVLDPKKIELMPDEPVSIKTLGSLFQATSIDSQERRLWRILEELVT
ncbi:MAG TPA: hypothetical protein VM432_12930 [Bdellovibrionales bacterium]|nr:hypothetical protein [Bdellovibrionales bacterium]